MNKKFFLLTFINTFLILTVAAWLFYGRNDRIAYADYSKLFDGFRMTKEMTSSGQKEYDRRIKRIDSLYLLMNIKGENERPALVMAINNQKDSLAVFKERYIGENSITIKKRIESYAQQFAEERNYSMVLSFQTNDGALYCEPSKDVTAELLNYINKKYEGLP